MANAARKRKRNSRSRAPRHRAGGVPSFGVTARAASTSAIFAVTFAALSGPAAVGISLDPQRVTAAAPIDLSAIPAPSPIAAIRVTEAGTTVAERPEILADGSAANGESVTTATGVVSSEGADAGLPGNLRLTHPVANFRLTSLFGWRKNPTGPGSHIHIGQDYAVSCLSLIHI